jgi:hypothetical protein
MQKPMRKANSSSKRVLDKLTEGLSRVGDHAKIDNATGVFMPVSVEIVDRNVNGYLYVSVAHYGKLNGDLMRDPEMVFIKARVSGDYYSSYFRNDYLGCERLGVVSAEQVEGRPSFSFNPREQVDEAAFANAWMRNILQQQRLFEKPQAAAA